MSVYVVFVLHICPVCLFVKYICLSNMSSSVSLFLVLMSVCLSRVYVNLVSLLIKYVHLLSMSVSQECLSAVYIFLSIKFCVEGVFAFSNLSLE
jgi:uncharacterized membrane protein